MYAATESCARNGCMGMASFASKMPAQAALPLLRARAAGHYIKKWLYCCVHVSAARQATAAFPAACAAGACASLESATCPSVAAPKLLGRVLNDHLVVALQGGSWCVGRVAYAIRPAGSAAGSGGSISGSISQRWRWQRQQQPAAAAAASAAAAAEAVLCYSSVPASAARVPACYLHDAPATRPMHVMQITMTSPAKPHLGAHVAVGGEDIARPPNQLRPSLPQRGASCACYAIAAAGLAAGPKVGAGVAPLRPGEAQPRAAASHACRLGRVRGTVQVY